MHASHDHTPRRRRPLTISQGGQDEDNNGTTSLIKTTTTNDKKRRKRRKGSNEPPFYILVGQVGSVLFIICFALLLTYRYFVSATTSTNIVDDDDDNDIVHFDQANKDTTAKLQRAPTAPITRPPTMAPTPAPIPKFNLTSEAKYDAFGLAERYAPKSDSNLFWSAVQGMLTQFSELYGGENAARGLLQTALTTYSNITILNENNNDSTDLPETLVHTACRIKQAKDKNRPFIFAFGGYSVTAGRGNYFSQSFPLVMKKQLHTVFNLLGIELKVTNAAIGGCPSFPYGWCMSNFWPRNADVVSWDFSMNEAGGDPLGLEAYVRHVLQLPRRPKLLVKDTYMASDRRNVLREYLPYLRDPVVLHTEPAVQAFLKMSNEASRPLGFRQWRKFGGPSGSPGQVLHHPAVAEHQFLAWMYTMHIVSALQIVAASGTNAVQLTCPSDIDNVTPIDLPAPIYLSPNATVEPWQSLTWGEKVENSTSWKMNPVHCRTTFEPISKNTGNQSADLHSIVVSGTTGESLDIMLPKSKMYYNKAWVLDLSDGEKKAKKQLELYGGLGFIDSKKAYYGLYSSHTMRLLLPVNAQDMPKVGDAAAKFFKSVTICQVNEKRDAYGACDAKKDMNFTVGDIPINATSITAPGSLYLGRQLCVYLRVPDNATLTSKSEMEKTDYKGLILPDNDNEDDVIGLPVGIAVSNIHINKREQACSVSHVIWELKS